MYQAQHTNLGDGYQVQRSYDNNGQLLNVGNLKSDGSSLASFTTSYDAAGQRINQIEPQGIVSYSYDATYQLIKE